jgi:predicted NBD/HSP70 family sugar kinase
MILTVEVGGSSIQAVLFEHRNRGEIVPLEEHRSDRWLLAAPGLVRGDSIQGAHHLGWLNVQASSVLGMSSTPRLSTNDAAAAALGEWCLRGQPDGTWLYIGLGTGVGAAAIARGVIIPVGLSHLPGFGTKRCGGCGRVGCLDAQIGGHALPTPLRDDDIAVVVEILGAAIEQQAIGIDGVIVGGGITRKYPDIVSRLSKRVKPAVQFAACPEHYKSAAPFGLIHLWQAH